jgi:hypothetical protein
MTPELAKKLHDNGFPNLAVYAHSFNHEPNDNPHKGGWNVKATCKFCGEVREYASSSTLSTTYFEGCPVISNYIFPTLSELIEACGDCLSHIKKWGGYWWAVSHCGHPEHEFGGNNLEEQGITPEESVAKLWLELNKKI